MDSIYEYQHIVIGGEGYNTLGLIRCLGENNIKPIVILICKNSRLIKYSKYIKELYLVSNEEEAYRLLHEELLNHSAKKCFVYTGKDRMISVLDKNYDFLKDHCYFFNAGESGVLNRYINKDQIRDLALSFDLNVLNSWKVKRGEVPDDIVYPIITKSISPLEGKWKDDVYICESEDELVNAYNKIESEVILLQSYIEKKDEIEFEGCSVRRENRIEAFIALELNFVYTIKDRYGPYLRVHNIGHLDEAEKIKDMLRLIGFEGLFEAEFLVGQDDKLYFSEINFRFSPWAYNSSICGMSLPVLWANAVLNPDYNLNNQLKTFEPYYAIDEFSDFKYRVMGKKTSVFKWIKEFTQAKCKYFFNRKDPKPFFMWILRKI